MRVTKITFEQLFPTGVYQNQRLGIEIAVGEDEQTQTEEVFGYAKELVNKAFKVMNPDAVLMHDFNTGIPSSPPVINREKEKVEIGIENSQTQADLDYWADGAEKYDLIGQWNKKHSELTP